MRDYKNLPYVRLIVSSLLYQLLWFVAVISASRPQWVLLAPIVVLVLGGVQLLLWPMLLRRAVWVCVSALVLGFLVDSVLIRTGVFVVERTVVPFPFAPLWLLSLWAGFGLYIAIGLERLYGKYLLAALAGFLGGPLAYRAGVSFGAVQLTSPVWGSLLWIGLVWTVVFSALVWLAGLNPDAFRPRRSCRAFLLPALLIWQASSLDALSISGDENRFMIERRVGEQVLVRQGVGRLTRFMITACDIALYAPPETSRATLLDGGPRLLEFLYYVSLKGRHFAVAAERSLQQNVAPDVYARFSSEIKAMSALYANVRSGDRYLLVFVPGDGLTLLLNGRALGTVPGDEFGTLYLSIWLGKNPIDRDLYDDMTVSLDRGAQQKSVPVGSE